MYEKIKNIDITFESDSLSDDAKLSYYRLGRGLMLVLTRKQGETITIDGDITIQVVQVKGRQVRIGISAPKSKKVQRGELLEPLKDHTKTFILTEDRI